MMSESLGAALGNEGLAVLDAWPIMQWFRGKDPGRDEFAYLLSQSVVDQVVLCISRINLARFITRSRETTVRRSLMHLSRSYRRRRFK